MNNNKLVILSILFTSNNILYSITRLNGDILFWTSSGVKKIKGTKKITSTSIITITKTVIQQIFNFNYSCIYVKVKGFNKNKKTVIRQLKHSFLDILLISDETSYPHNGCKRTKIRRI